jgi:hypothetical protein
VFKRKMALVVPRRIVGNESDKRQRMDISSFGGMNNRSTDGSKYQPMDVTNTVGADGNWASGHVNGDIEVKVVAVPPKHGRQWLNNYPQHSLLFGTTSTFQEDIKALKARAREHIFRQIDCMELHTPEQMNYVMHIEWANTPVDKRPTMDELFRKWRCVGVLTDPPVNSTSMAGTKRIGQDRVLNFYQTCDNHVVNYWGPGVSGTKDSYVYWVLRLEPVSRLSVNNPFPTYILSRDGTDVRTEDWCFKEGSGALTNRTVMDYIPRWVPVSSSHPKCPNESDLMYDYHGVPCVANYISVGRLVVNTQFNEAFTKKALSRMEDMSSTCSLAQVDILVRLNEGFYTCN